MLRGASPSAAPPARARRGHGHVDRHDDPHHCAEHREPAALPLDRRPALGLGGAWASRAAWASASACARASRAAWASASARARASRVAWASASPWASRAAWASASALLVRAMQVPRKGLRDRRPVPRQPAALLGLRSDLGSRHSFASATRRASLPEPSRRRHASSRLSRRISSRPSSRCRAVGR